VVDQPKTKNEHIIDELKRRYNTNKGNDEQ
jgi:hypothetical protein